MTLFCLECQVETTWMLHGLPLCPICAKPIMASERKCEEAYHINNNWGHP